MYCSNFFKTFSYFNIRSGARLIRSKRAGVGKSLQKKNLCTDLRVNRNIPGKDITIALHKSVDTDGIIKRLKDEFGYTNDPNDDNCNTIHIDIAHEVMLEI